MRITHGSFEYIYDNYTMLEAIGEVPCHPTAERRLVAVHGLSAPRPRRRDDGRPRGWVEPTERTFGRQWDKGHFVAHSMGGAMDGVEASVFVHPTAERGHCARQTPVNLTAEFAISAAHLPQKKLFTSEQHSGFETGCSRGAERRSRKNC